MKPASLGELDLLVLALLQADPCHGYLLVRRLKEQCSQSAVYRALRRLQEDGLIRAQTVLQEKLPSRYEFTLTPSGMQAVAAEESWTSGLQDRLDRVGRSYRKLQMLMQFQPIR